LIARISAVLAIASTCVITSGCGVFPLGRKVDYSIPEKIDPVLFRTEIFGEESSKPINTGYFIYKGRYVPPPYVVRRTGLSLHINDIMVIGPMKWKSINEKNLDSPPEIPNISMWCESDALTEFIDGTFSYYESLYKGPNPPQDKTMLKAVSEHLNKLPNVWDTEVDEERQLIRIHLCNFTSFNVSSSSVFGLASTGISEEAIRDMYQRAYEKHVSYFKDNKIVYRGLKISEIEWLEDVTTFYDAVKILNSNSWSFTKRSNLAKINFASEKIVRDLVSCYKPSKELEKRLYDEYVKALDEQGRRKKTTPFDKFK